MWALVLILLSVVGFAETRRELDVLAKDGKRFEVNAFYYKNSNGAREIRIESAGLPRINDKINSVLGYGRDLDEDDLVETWFLISPEKGVVTTQAKCITKDCTSTIEDKLFINYERSDRMLIYSAYASIVSYFFMSLDNRYEKTMDFYREHVNLEEFRIRLDRELDSKTPSLNREQLGQAVKALAFGYQENIAMLERAKGKDAYALLAADTVIHAAGSMVLKYAGKFLYATGFLQGLLRYLDDFIKAHSQALSKYSMKLEKLKFGTVLIGATAVQKMNREIFKRTITHGLHTMRARSFMYKNLHLIKTKTVRALKAGGGQWRYLALNAGIQVTAETYANYSDVYDEDPHVMAENVMNNKQIQQNVGYMATETLLMTMAVKTFKTVKARYAMCAFIAVANSAFTNLVMRDEINPERVIMDTTWEMLVGSTQVQLDQWMLDKFEKIGRETGNTKLKLLGYAAVVLEQGIGYYVYSKSTEIVDVRAEMKENLPQEQIIMWQPVLVKAP